MHVMSSEFIHCETLYFYLHPYVHSYPCGGLKQPGAVKKGAAKQSRIKRIISHLRWLVRTRAGISLQPSE